MELLLNSLLIFFSFNLTLPLLLHILASYILFTGLFSFIRCTYLHHTNCYLFLYTFLILSILVTPITVFRYFISIICILFIVEFNTHSLEYCLSYSYSTLNISNLVTVFAIYCCFPILLLLLFLLCLF